MDEKPIFEITNMAGKTYRIWADGRLEGFDDMQPCVVINRAREYAMHGLGPRRPDWPAPGSFG
jgi:hypothetical protein